jgi:hypothetical protein
VVLAQVVEGSCRAVSARLTNTVSLPPNSDWMPPAKLPVRCANAP